jgi:hypothetical protein
MGLRPYHPVSREFLWDALRSELAAIGITEEERVRRNIVYHSLRHSFVTACRVAGLSDFETMALSRHKDRKMLERYTHEQEALDGELLRALGDKINNSFGAFSPSKPAEKTGAGGSPGYASGAWQLRDGICPARKKQEANHDSQ